MDPATARYVELVEQIRQLARISDNRDNSDEEREAARRAREPLIVEAGQLFDDVLREHQANAVSEPVIVDRGLSVLVGSLLVKLRREVERELERNDLTPYMYSTLVGKRDALSKVFRMFDSRALKWIDDFLVPEYLLVAEYDDDSVDFKEAADREEADEILADYVERGAVVTRYAVYPEVGNHVVLYYPVMPHENVHKSMTQRQYNWVLRRKGADNLTLPENVDEFITRPYGAADSEEDQ